MDIQKINWKFFVEDPVHAAPDIFFKVFNTWIPDDPEIFVDVADYQHVHDGPLIALVGYYTDYWLDTTDRRVGLLYNRRLPMEGTNGEKLGSSFREILQACVRLQNDPEFKGRLRFRKDEFLFIINDRGIAPNTKETFDVVRPELESILDGVYGKNQYSVEHLNHPKQRFSVKIIVKQSPEIESLIQRLPAAQKARA